jgi:NAD-dependent SIR2 family protein deacetylase
LLVVSFHGTYAEESTNKCHERRKKEKKQKKRKRKEKKRKYIQGGIFPT